MSATQPFWTIDWRCRPSWRRASVNTLWCLAGCSIGDMGTILAFQLLEIDWPVMAIMGLAMVNGILTSIALETIILSRQMALGAAFKTAIGMSLISMIAMELAMNGVDLIIMGGARLSCEGGCSCPPQTLSGRHAQHTSTTAVAHIKIRLTRSVSAPLNRTVTVPSHGTQSGYQSAGWGNATLCPCTLSVENIKGPEWLGAKFKVSMMMLADNRGKVRWVDTWKTQWLHIGDSSQRTTRLAGQ